MPDPRAALGDRRLHEILDLCLECKACKSECPLGVDMASLKTEALAAYHEQHGVPLRSRMFGSVRALNRMGSAAAPLANLLGGVRPARLLARALAGGGGGPAAAPVPAAAPGQVARPPPGAPRQPAVNLSFSRIPSPATPSPRWRGPRSNCWRRPGGRCGWRRRACCGRASLSKGLVDQARNRARNLAGPGGRPWPGRRRGTVLPADAARRVPGDPARRSPGEGRRRGQPGCPRNCSARRSPTGGSPWARSRPSGSSTTATVT